MSSKTYIRNRVGVVASREDAVRLALIVYFDVWGGGVLKRCLSSFLNEDRILDVIYGPVFFFAMEYNILPSNVPAEIFEMLLEEDDSRLVIGACHCLEKYGKQGSVSLLATKLNHVNHSVRSSALCAIAKIDKARCLELLNTNQYSIMKTLKKEICKYCKG